MKSKYGSAAYAMEELRAELSSAFIAGELGIPADIPQHASYIQNWLKPLKDSKHEIFRAAADAQKIVDMVLGFRPDSGHSKSPRARSRLQMLRPLLRTQPHVHPTTSSEYLLCSAGTD